MSPAAFAAATRRLSTSKQFQRGLRKAYRRVGTFGAKVARAEMRSSGDRRLARASRAISGTSSAESAAIGSRATNAVPEALATIWGTNRRTGWFADPKFDTATGQQHPTHVGNSWKPATRGQGPRGLNDALANNQEAIEQMFVDEALEVVARELPSGSVR